jgi:RNA 2',3'-cyclic 3'-phosphodiesterase
VSPISARGERRLFVAAYPPGPAVEDLGRVVDGLQVSLANRPGRSTRVSARHRWHVTLAFLGDVPESRIEKAAQAVQRAAQRPTPPIEISFAGAGTFGRGRSTILWAGLGGDVPALRALAATLRAELRRARLPFDPKPFQAHLTLARPGSLVPAEAIAADVATLGSYAGPAWPVDTVHLVASELGPDPRYVTVASFPIGPATAPTDG